MEQENKDKLEFNIGGQSLRAFEQYLTLMNPLIPVKLKALEIKVLSCFMYFDYTNRNLPKDKRDIILFSKDTKKRICRKLVISEDAVNNVISSLYKKKYLSKDKKFTTRMPQGNKIVINFNINISDEVDENLEKELDVIKKPD